MEMVKITLYNALRGQEFKLEQDETIKIGRGVFDCQDKRISRNHGELTVIETQIRVKANHINPIFYKREGTGPRQILTKDSEINLGHSDKFSLLPDEFEFEIRVVASNDEQANVAHLAGNAEVSASTSGTDLRIRNISEINHNLEDGNLPTSLSQIIGQSSNLEETLDHDRTPSPEFLTAPSQIEPSHVPSNEALVAGRKRSFEFSDDSSEDAAKKQRTSSPALNLQTDQPSSTTNQQLVPLPVNPPSSSMPLITIKPDPDSTTSSNDQNASSSTGTTIANAIVKPDPDGTTVKTESASNVAGPPIAVIPQILNPALRQSCNYGIRCYRHTPDHRSQMAHPGDTDYRRPTYPPAPTDSPNCPYGAACYRRNPDHFRELQHPSADLFTVASRARPIIIQQVFPHHDDDDDDFEFDGNDSDLDPDFVNDGESSPDEDLVGDDEDGEENNVEE